MVIGACVVYKLITHKGKFLRELSGCTNKFENLKIWKWRTFRLRFVIFNSGLLFCILFVSGGKPRILSELSGHTNKFENLKIWRFENERHFDQDSSFSTAGCYFVFFLFLVASAESLGIERIYSKFENLKIWKFENERYFDQDSSFSKVDCYFCPFVCNGKLPRLFANWGDTWIKRVFFGIRNGIF